MLDEHLDSKVLDKLIELEKIAIKEGDDYLLGFTYYYRSFAIYYFDSERVDFTKYLSLAVKYLMKVEDHEMLARVYNLIAIDAYAFGSYDVTYNYYLNALHEAKADGSIVFLTVIETNLSLLFLELRDFQKAKKHIKNAIRYMSKYLSKEFKFFSLHAAYVDEAAIYLELEEYDKAKESLDKAMAVLPSTSAPDEDLKLSISLIQFRLAHVDNNTRQANKYFKAIIDCLKNEQYPEGYIGDIRNITLYLLNTNELKKAKEIIDAVNDRILACDKAHITRIITTLKIELAKKLHDDVVLKQTLKQQQDFMKLNKSNINKVYGYTLDLVRIDNNIRKAQLETQKERERLEEKAYHDALTSLPNRRLMNQQLASSFESCYRKKLNFGVGILDLDFFKIYNDTYGHLKGDECLKDVANILKDIASRNYKSGKVYAGRYGGDEFLIIYEALSKKEVNNIAFSIHEEICKKSIAFDLSKLGNTISVTQGICVDKPRNKQKIWDYLDKADDAMYEVKKGSISERIEKNGISIKTLKRGLHVRER